MTGKSDVTDSCASNFALNWLGESLRYQQKYKNAIRVYEQILEINQTLGLIIKLRRQKVGKRQLSLAIITYELFFAYLLMLSSLCRFLNE